MPTPDEKKTTLSKRAAVFSLALVLALGSVAVARSLGSPVLVTTPANRLQPFRFFGGRTVTVPVRVLAPEPRRGLSLGARLVQLASGLAAPVGAALEVPLPADASPAGVEIELAVPLPAVQREIDFELRFQARRDHDGLWHAAGHIPVRVYPADLLRPIRRWATTHPLRVADDHGSLIRFLRRRKIPVVEGGAQGLRDGRGVILYSGARALAKRALVPLRQGEAIILFTEEETETPRFLIERKGGGTAVTVEMRLLDRLPTDPLAHRIFLELFEIINEEKQSMGGDDR